MHLTTYIIPNLARQMFWWSLVLQDRSSNLTSYQGSYTESRILALIDVNIVPKHYIRTHFSKMIFHEKNRSIDNDFFP